MLSKLKSILPLSTIMIALCFAIYFGYEQYQDKKEAKAQYEQLKTDIDGKEKELIRQYEISTKAEQDKLIAENQSLALQEQLNDALKNNTCATELVPADVANKLYERASNIRQAAANTSQLIK